MILPVACACADTDDGADGRSLKQGALRLDRAEALSYVGYAGQELDENLLQRFEELACACERDLRPACVHATFDVDEEASKDADAACVVLADANLVLPGHDIVAHLRGARWVALMACTLGMASERELRKHAAFGPTDALLYSAAASALVEAAANATEAAIVAEAFACNRYTNTRYSPGYGDLTLDVQPVLLAALNAPRRIGLMATKDNLLVPTKSVTAVVGLFDRPCPETDVRTSCASCQLRTCCQIRRKGATCHGR